MIFLYPIHDRNVMDLMVKREIVLVLMETISKVLSGRLILLKYAQNTLQKRHFVMVLKW